MGGRRGEMVAGGGLRKEKQAFMQKRKRKKRERKKRDAYKPLSLLYSWSSLSLSHTHLSLFCLSFAQTLVFFRLFLSSHYFTVFSLSPPTSLPSPSLTLSSPSVCLSHSLYKTTLPIWPSTLENPVLLDVQVHRILLFSWRCSKSTLVTFNNHPPHQNIYSYLPVNYPKWAVCPEWVCPRGNPSSSRNSPASWPSYVTTSPATTTNK